VLLFTIPGCLVVHTESAVAAACRGGYIQHQSVSMLHGLVSLLVNHLTLACCKRNDSFNIIASIYVVTVRAQPNTEAEKLPPITFQKLTAARMSRPAIAVIPANDAANAARKQLRMRRFAAWMVMRFCFSSSAREN